MMKRQSVEQTLQDALRQGEQVLWDGTSAEFPLLAGDSRNQILGKWIGTAAGTAVVLALYLGNAGGRSVGMILGILAVAVMVILSPFVEQRSVLRQHYYVTSQRVILISGDQTVYYMELGEIDEIRTVTDGTEYDSLVVGSAVFEDIKSQMRWRSCHPKMDSKGGMTSGEAMGLILFNLRDCQGAETLVRQYQEGSAGDEEQYQAVGA
nr:hypothetical protein [uncultured Dysosmobacter sp.]